MFTYEITVMNILTDMHFTWGSCCVLDSASCRLTCICHREMSPSRQRQNSCCLMPMSLSSICLTPVKLHAFCPRHKYPSLSFLKVWCPVTLSSVIIL